MVVKTVRSAFIPKYVPQWLKVVVTSNTSVTTEICLSIFVVETMASHRLESVLLTHTLLKTGDAS